MVFRVQLMALVLLGCRVRPGFDLPPAAGRRVRRTAEAFGAGLAPRVLVCGGKRWDGVSEAVELARALAELGVPEAAIELEIESLSTFQNARGAARILLPRSLTRIGVVTCDWHMPRALRCFEKLGFDPLPIAAPAPRRSRAYALARGLRERVSFWADTLSTWGLGRV